MRKCSFRSIVGIFIFLVLSGVAQASPPISFDGQVRKDALQAYFGNLQIHFPGGPTFLELFGRLEEISPSESISNLPSVGEGLHIFTGTNWPHDDLHGPMGAESALIITSNGKIRAGAIAWTSMCVSKIQPISKAKAFPKPLTIFVRHPAELKEAVPIFVKWTSQICNGPTGTLLPYGVNPPPSSVINKIIVLHGYGSTWVN